MKHSCWCERCASDSARPRALPGMQSPAGRGASQQIAGSETRLQRDLRGCSRSARSACVWMHERAERALRGSIARPANGPYTILDVLLAMPASRTSDSHRKWSCEVYGVKSSTKSLEDSLSYPSQSTRCFSCWKSSLSTRKR